jgi:hypothetical protein
MQLAVRVLRALVEKGRREWALKRELIDERDRKVCHCGCFVANVRKQIASLCRITAATVRCS